MDLPARKEKMCRICGRSCAEFDPVVPKSYILWGYKSDEKIVNDLVVVGGKVDWWCIKVNELEHRKASVVDLGKMYEADKDSTGFANNWEVSRDAVIAMATELGVDNVKKKQLMAYKEQVISETVSLTERSRGAMEYTKEKFEELFANNADVLKRAQYVGVRVRSGRGWKTEQRVKVYDHEEGIYRVKEADVDAVRRQKMLNDGEMNRSPTTAQEMHEDLASAMAVGVESCKPAFVAKDLGLSASSSSFVAAAASPPSVAEAKRRELKPQPTDSSGDDDAGATPFSTMVGTSAPGPKAKTRAKAPKAAQGTPTTNSISITGAKTIVPAPLTEKAKMDGDTLLKESGDAMVKFKEAQRIEDIPQESISSLCGRLQSKSRTLAKKPGNQAGVDLLSNVNKVKRKLNPLFELTKAALAFAKSHKKPNCKKVLDRFEEALEGGNVVDELAPCFRAVVVQAQVWIVMADGKFEEASCNDRVVLLEMGNLCQFIITQFALC